MELYLKQIAINTENIVHNTDSKSSFFITQNQTSSQIITRYNPVIELDKNKNYEMALYDMDVDYSFQILMQQITSFVFLRMRDEIG